MNYIELINSFWKIDHDFKFSSLETALYFRLLSKANSTCWQEEFIYTNARLMEDLDCSVSKLRHARDRLLKAGLFTYVSGSKSIPGKYSLLSQHNHNTTATESRQKHDTNADNTESLSLEGLREDRPTVLATIASQSQHNDDTIQAQKQQIIINKTKLNKTKQDNILSPNGETKTSFSNPHRGEEEIYEEEAYRKSDKGSIVSSSRTTQKVQGSFHLISSSLSYGTEDTPQNCRSSLPEQSEVVSPKSVEASESVYLETEDGLVASSLPLQVELTRYEEDVIGLWETVIGPFDPSWLSSLKSLLKKCYPSQIKNAIFSLSRTKFDVMKDVGFSYVEQPLLNGMFGKRGNNDGRKNRQCAGKFESDIEKFKNPARAKPKTREELLKYTQY